MKRHLLGLAVLAAWAAALGAASPAWAQAPGEAIAAIRARGEVLCGVSPDLIGFSRQQEGRWSGFNVEYCRALAAVLLRDATRVRYVEVPNPDTAFAAIRERRIDLAVSNLTRTLRRYAVTGAYMPVVIFFDSEGFLVPKALLINSADQLASARICVVPGTTTQIGLADYFALRRRVTFEQVPVADPAAGVEALLANRCAAYASDTSELTGHLARLGRRGEDLMILSEVIQKSPLGIAIHSEERALGTLVSWIHYAMVTGEELGVGQETLDIVRTSDVPAIETFLGAHFDIGEPLDVDREWTQRLIREVGNYGEIFQRHLAPIGIRRGLNASWRDGGLHYAPPFR